MESLEEQLRKNMVKILFVSTIVALLFNVIVMISIIHSNSLSMPLPEYILKRVCLPFFVNIASSFTAMIVIKR